MKEKAMVLFSGGVDSTTCLGLAIERYGKENVIPLSIIYGQKHAKELEAARKILDYYEIEGMELDLSSVFANSDSSLLSHSHKEIPEESYARQMEKGNGAFVDTYVPFRNGLFLAAAASMALSMGCSCIYYGAHQDDAAGSAYPDCSEAFFNSMNRAVCEGSGRTLRMEAPFISCNKAQVVKEGLRLQVPYELTWSCYEGDERPCGRCATCIDRKKAFEANHVVDMLGK